VSVSDAGGNATIYDCDPFCKLIRLTDAVVGNVVTAVYDVRAREA
jgi:YD repeat-containing protein